MLEIGSEVWYVHNDKLPEIRKGIVVEPPPGLASPIYVYLRPAEYPNSRILTESRRVDQVSPDKAGVYKIIYGVIQERRNGLRKQIEELNQFQEGLSDAEWLCLTNQEGD